MIIYQRELINWTDIQNNKRRQQIKDNERENRGRSSHNYTVGERVLIIKRIDERTGKLLNYEHEGPFEVIKVYPNGTVKINRSGFNEIINNRRIKPYKD